MVIGIDASRANREKKTGTEWYSFYVIKHLAEIDRKNQYRLYLNEPARPDLVAAIKNNPNFSLKFLGWPLYSFWTLGRLSWEMLWRRPDVLFIPAHTLPLFYPRKTANTIHDIAFVREKNLYRSQKPKTDWPSSRRVIDLLIRLFTGGKYGSTSTDYLFWSTAFALRRARKIITVSEFTKQEILLAYPRAKAEKIRVVHNGYNDSLYRPIDNKEKIAAVLEKYGLEAPYFLYVGRLEKKKNTPALVEAMAILRESHPAIKEKLVLIGDASFGFDEVKYAIEEFNLNNQVQMPGWVEEADMPYIFSGATAFIFPTKHEGFGIPLIQALACGLPSAASDIPVLREVAGEAALFFNHYDKKQIAEAMYQVASNPDLRLELRSKGLERDKQFSWKKCARETLVELEGM